MNTTTQLVMFTLDGRRFALPVAAVERIVLAVEVTPLPQAPEVILGVINVQGQVLSVISLRKRCRLPARDIELSDRLIIARTSNRTVALLVDSAEVIECAPDTSTPTKEFLPGFDGVQEVVRHGEELILLFDLDRLLLPEEERELNSAIRPNESRAGESRASESRVGEGLPGDARLAEGAP